MAQPGYIPIRTCDPSEARAAACALMSRRMTDAELQQYARRTTKRPLLCFAIIAAMPFVAECICRLIGA
jgi:hypothetical protein